MSTGLGVVEWWLHWMLRMSWQVAVLAVAVWALTRLLRRSSASLRYSLWLLVFIKLLLPPGLSAPWSPATVAANAWPAGVRWTVDMPAVHSTSTAPAQWPALSADTFTESAPVADRPPVTVSPAPKAAVSVPHAIMAIWAVVALGLLLLMTVQWRLHSRRLLRDAVLAPEEILVWGRTQALLLGLRRPVEIYVSPQVLVPCVMGFRKAIVFLPQDLIARLSPAQQADLIAHEIAHIKRGDLWTGWFASTLVCLYWFHPAVWLANFQLRREREMACDDKVLHATRREGTEYASTMVRVAEGFRGGVPAGAGFLGLFELADNLLQRVRAVSDATRTRRAGWRASITVVVVALAVIPMGAWTSVSHAQATPPQPAASAEPQQAPPAAAQPAEKASEAPTDNVQAAEKEIAEHYAAAAPELKEYIKWTARTFGRGGMWLPENAFESLTPEQREEKVKYLVEVLNGEYGRYLCGALAEAGVLKDARLLPGLTKHAGYHREDSDYDCRPKWIAVASLGRHDEPSSAPLLVDLADHGNQNTKMWAQASMSRLTGQNFGTDKKAWAEWWNANGKKPKIDVAALKAWKPVGESAPAVGAGRMGKVLRFDGLDDYIHIPPTPQLDLTADVTVGAWIKVAPECRG
ncbi:MAG: M56 family metallopeptidase, partial [FCB group bacterium]|nr:M56 family metallopeptidase [FCB group bacterium]